MSPALLQVITQCVATRPTLSFHALNYKGDYQCNFNKTVTALTWGYALIQCSLFNSYLLYTWSFLCFNACRVFPDKEVLQPTVFDPASFGVWGEECFSLWIKSWAALYDDETDTAGLLYEVQ